MSNSIPANQKQSSKINNFIDDVIKFISEHHRPINIFELYDLYTPKYGSRKNSASHTEYLLKIATQTNRLKRYDRAVPNGESLPLYPGKHKAKVASFLIDTSIDELDQIEAVDNYFNSLVEQARIIKDNKIIEKKERNKKNVLENYHKKQALKSTSSEECLIPKKEMEKSPSTSYNFQQNCFMFSKYVRLHIIHSFILNTFGTLHFTVKECAKQMSVDLLMKVAGVLYLPNIFLQQPKLRFIIIDCFPKSILKEFDFDQACCQIAKLLSILHEDYNILKKIRKSTFKIYSTNYELQYGTNDPVIINLFDLMEHFDAISSAAWLKKWSLIKLKNTKSPPIIESILSKDDISEKRAVEKEGIDLSLIKDPLKEFDTTKDLDLFCQSNQILLKNFEISDHQMALYISNEEFKSFSDGTLRNAICSAVSLGVVTVGGVAVKSFVPWEEIKRLVCSIFPQYSDRDSTFFLRAHANAMWSINGYKNAFERSIALSIAAVKSVQNDDDMLYEISEHQIYSRFNIARMALHMPTKIAELVEALKRKFCTKIRYYSATQEQKFLQEFDWNGAHEALLSLRLINYITRVQSPDSRMPVFIRSNSFLQGLWRDKLFYCDLAEIQNESRIGILSHATPVHKLTAAYFETVLSNFDQFYDIEYDQSALTNDSSNLLFNINRRLVSLPLLPDIEITIPDLKLKNNMGSTNKTEVLLDSINEANSILENFGYINTLPFLITLGFVTFSGSDGIPLDELIQKMEPVVPLASDVIYCVEFLEGFGLILRLHSTSIIPRFASPTELPKKTSRVGHAYTGINRDVSVRLARESQMAVFEAISDHPGIEILELLSELPHISFFDLLTVLEALIADEAIYCTEVLSSTSLFRSENTPMSPAGNYQLALLVAETDADPSIERPLRYYYPTKDGALMLSHLGEI